MRALVALMLVSFVVNMPVADASHRNRERIDRQLRAARARLYQAKRSDAEVLSVIATISGQLQTVQGRLAIARRYLAGIQARIDVQQRRLSRIQARRNAFLGEVALRARQLYIMGPAGAQAWLEAKTMNEFLSRSSSVEFLSRSNKRQVEHLAALNHQTKEIQSSLVGERKRAQGAKSNVSEQYSIVAEVLGAHREAEAILHKRVAAYQAEVAALQAEQNRIQGIIYSRSSAYTGGKISRSGFAWPIRGRITSPYGPRWGSFHTGIDIDCSTGDPIGAAKAGTVIASEWGGGYGNMTIVDHGGGVTTLYAHQSRLIARRGQSVGQHQVVGLCGATGRATGDHLHFEVRVNGQHTNPINWLP